VGGLAIVLGSIMVLLAVQDSSISRNRGRGYRPKHRRSSRLRGL
jgi:hypothetical protein